MYTTKNYNLNISKPLLDRIGLKWIGNDAKIHVADKEDVSIFGDIWMIKINGELVGDTNRNL